MVGLFGILKVLFKTRLKLVDAFDVVDDKGPSGSFILFRHMNPFIKKFLYPNNITHQGALS